MLIDTSVVIDLSRGSAEARAFIEDMAGPPAVSVMTATEVLRCARTKSESRLFERLFQAWTVIPFDLEIAQSAARLTTDYADGQRRVDMIDALIAATAMSHGMEIATVDTARFPMFPDLAPAY